MLNLVIKIIPLFSILILCLSFIKYKLALILYLAYMILVPYMAIGPLSYGSINTILLCAFIFNYKIQNNNTSLDFRIMTPFWFLFTGLFLISLFTITTPLSYQFLFWRHDFMMI